MRPVGQPRLVQPAVDEEVAAGELDHGRVPAPVRHLRADLPGLRPRIEQERVVQTREAGLAGCRVGQVSADQQHAAIRQQRLARAEDRGRHPIVLCDLRRGHSVRRARLRIEHRRGTEVGSVAIRSRLPAEDQQLARRHHRGVDRVVRQRDALRAPEADVGTRLVLERAVEALLLAPDHPLALLTLRPSHPPRPLARPALQHAQHGVLARMLRAERRDLGGIELHVRRAGAMTGPVRPGGRGRHEPQAGGKRHRPGDVPAAAHESR